ncbi:ribonucleoside-diphosphate reductase subunit alpha [Plasticicumulans acidivorans]|uniref:Ribonucleoside-diphosphate reductase n=1 Tax=Plasticicumulans acidivorans TaxID=886464 RepID=A0A317MZF4_9GAMM|nr:ribonucleoside-diphosphate reductase subunit alpha [Plasticicumulans acidivorans]PWV65556.1 ribonucleoside-diphosphate reductase alpha chain [Plasticicumulans acidivorans]
MIHSPPALQPPQAALSAVDALLAATEAATLALDLPLLRELAISHGAAQAGAEVHSALLLAARTLIERDPAYDALAVRLQLLALGHEVLGAEALTLSALAAHYPAALPAFVTEGIAAEQLDPRLGEFDLARLAAALRPERDRQFGYLGLQTLYDRYFLHIDGRRIELPQVFFMRVAMGLALNEAEREARAIEFYELLSSFAFMCSTPTLFNAGTCHPQLSSCYLTTVDDDLEAIFQAVKENALLQKYAGGLGNDWTPVRALGSRIRGTNGISQGVIPFLKVVNDTAVAVNQCFAPDTVVFTADGPRPIREVIAGDLVLGCSGRYREVTQKFTYNQREPMLRLDVTHALAPLHVTTGHPFYAIRGVPPQQTGAHTRHGLEQGTLRPQWVEAGALQRGDYVAQVIPREIVPVAAFDADDARLYGILLGAGQLSDDVHWHVSGDPQRDTHLAFVRTYLQARGIPCREIHHGEDELQIHWAIERCLLREASGGSLSAGSAALSVTQADVVDARGRRRIARRFAHLPLPQTLALLHGLLEAGGSIRGKVIHFSSASQPLAEGLRYQLLRLGVPCAGRYREPPPAPGTQAASAEADGPLPSWALRIPAVPELAERLGCTPLRRRHWLNHGGRLYSRVRQVSAQAPCPFVIDLKVEGDASYMTSAGLAHNGGKRKGAVCAYLETWHLDIEDFLELRKNTGDERRRTHDMNTANWIPDLFMQRVAADAEWTLFSPSDVPDLHQRYGRDFARAYEAYEAAAARGEIRLFRRLPARQLWRKMLTMLFETGHPWLTFKDACNLRSPQQHVGVVHSSNLCTEITLNTAADETAVCNLGSVNLRAHLRDGALDAERLARTVNTAMRMLDNVIDLNYYATPKARNANLRHRPVGLGIMGFADCLHALGLPYASDAAVEFADRSMELVCFHAYRASSELAVERGCYSSFAGSLWAQGVLPPDTLARLRDERGGDVELDMSATLDWAALRAQISEHGMRNSNCVAIAPTATIANIVGVSASIEPEYRNLYVKSNLSGEFTVVNADLLRELRARGLWDEAMLHELKRADGALGRIARVPAPLKALYATAFEIDPEWLVEAAARRQKWIDQAQSLNLYVAGRSGRQLDALYQLAWRRGLKTTYYLRTLGATHTDAATLEAPLCSIDQPDCEACQ